MPDRPAFALLLGLLAAAPALAQTPSETGTGGGPSSTARAPNTTAVGQTKPPGSAAAPESPERRDARNDRQKDADKVLKGICIGCGAK